MEAKKVQTILGQMQKSLECSICLEMMSNPVSTNCGHQFCRFCLMEFLERKKQVPCPLCKKIITKRSLTEREQLGNIVGSIRQLITAFQMDTGELFSPPRGSQANIIPSTPEPSQPNSTCEVREQTEASKPGSRTRKKNTGAETGSTSNLRSVPVGKSKSRRNSRGKAKETTVTVPADIDPSTDELLKCIAEGIYGEAEDDDTSEDAPGVCYRKQRRHSSDLGSVVIDSTKDQQDSGCVEDNEVDNLRDKGPVSMNTRTVNDALLEMIENGSHGAMHSNSGDVQEQMETQESAQSVGLSHDAEIDNDDYNFEHSIDNKANEEDVFHLDHSIDSATYKEEKQVHQQKTGKSDVIVLSGVSDNDNKDVDASGNSGSGQYSLFRTPIDPKTVRKNNAKVKTATAGQARPRRSCRSKDNPHESDDKDGNEISDLLTNGESDFEEPEFLNEPKIQHTYDRKTKPNKAKDSVSTDKVAEWLKNIPVAENETNSENKNSETAIAHTKKGRKKVAKAQQEENVMGQRIKHLAEKVQHTHKDLLFNGDDFANSQKSIGMKDVDNEVHETKDIENDVKNLSNDAKSKETDGNPTVAHVVHDSKLTADNKMEDETVSVQQTVPLRKKRIFKTREENKGIPSHPPLGKASVNESTSDENKQDNCSLNQEHAKQSIVKTSDPYEFVSSQNTPVKPVKGKKKAKIISTNNKKKQLALPTYHGKFNQSTKTGKAIDSSQEQGLKAAKISASQKEINKVSANLDQAESYDLLTCTQEAAKEFTNEEKQSQRHTNKKKVSFREPVISDFIQKGKIDIMGYRKAKAGMDNKVDKGKSRAEEMRAYGKDDPTTAADVEDSKVSDKDKKAASSSMEITSTERPNDSDDDASEDWRFHDDSSGTDDLDIEPAETEYEQPDLDIQPDEIRAKLSQADFEKNILMKSQETEQLRSPEPSIIGETPLILTGPNFSEKPKSRSRKGSEARNEEIEQSNTADANLNEETPLIFAVPKFSKQTRSKCRKGRKNTDNEQEKLTPEVEQSIIEETPLLFAVPKFNEKSKPKNKMKSKTNESQSKMSDIDVKMQAVVPETPVLTFGSQDEASESLGAETEDVDPGKRPEEQIDSVADLETLPPDTSSKHGESSEETQAPSLEIMEVDHAENSGGKTELSHNNVPENASLNDNRAEPSLSSNLSDTLSQESTSILMSKPKEKNHNVSPNKAIETHKASNKGDILPCDTDKQKNYDLQMMKQKGQKGKKRKGKAKGANGKSKQDSGEKSSEEVPSESCEVTVIEPNETESNQSTRSTRRAGRCKKANQRKGSKCNESENVEKEDVHEEDNDRELYGNSQVSVISVDSATQRSVQVTEYRLSDPSNQEGLAKGTDTCVNSLSVVPDSVIDEDSTGMPESTNKHKDQIISQTKQMSASGSMSKERRGKKSRSLTKRNSSEESFRQRNLSGVLNSPQSSNIFNSPENIFAEDSEMPVLESSPFDETLQPCYLSDDEIVVFSKSKPSQPDVAIVAVNQKNHPGSDGVSLDTNTVSEPKAKSQKQSQEDSAFDKHKTCEDGKTNSQGSVKGAQDKATVYMVETCMEKPTIRSSQDGVKSKDEEDVKTPSPRNKRKSKTARGFAKRQRMSDVGSGDSNLSSLRSPANSLRSPAGSMKSPASSTRSPASTSSNIPTTPTVCTAQKYMSPAAKYMSPKILVSHNLPLIGQSPLQNKTLSPAENKFLTPSKRNVLAKKKCSPSVSKHTEAEKDNINSSLQAEVVEVNVGKDSEEDSDSETSTPKDLPDIDDELQTHNDIQSSTESVATVISNKDIQKSRTKRKRTDSGDPKENRQSTIAMKNENEFSESVKATNDTCSAVPDSFQGATDETISRPQVDEEIETVEETRSSEELNLDSSTEETVNDEDNNQADLVEKEKEAEECLSSPEFKLDSSDEEDLHEQALKEISKFNEIKEHAECLAKSMKSTSSNKTIKEHACSPKRVLVTETLEDDNRFSTNLDSSPMQPEVVQESDVESNDGEDSEESSEDSEDEVVRRKNVKKAVIDSSSDDDDENSRHMNCTSSSAFSSQSENLSTQERLALEQDLERMEREMRAMKAQLKLNKKSITPTKESTPVLSLNVDVDSDDAMIEAEDTGDEIEQQELFASPPPVSPAAGSQEIMDRGDQSEVEEYRKGDNNPEAEREDESVCRVTEKGDNEQADKMITESEMETLPPSLPMMPDLIPGQRSALKDLDPNVMETRKQPGEQKLINIIASGLSASQINEVKKLAAVNNVKFYNRFSRAVTHVIVKPDPNDDLLCDRTLKFFQGVANKCWIVNHFWVQDSKQVGYLLPEGAYEIQGDTANGTAHLGPKLSRQSNGKLFHNMEIALIGDNAYLSKDSLQELIEMCGGSVSEPATMNTSSQKCFVVSCTDVEEEDTPESQQIVAESKSLYKQYRLLTLTREWVLDSITMYSLQPLQEYVITKVKNLTIPMLQ